MSDKISRLDKILTAIGVGHTNHAIQFWHPAAGSSEADIEAAQAAALREYEAELGSKVPESDRIIYIANFGTPGEPAPPSPEAAPDAEEHAQPPRDPAIQARPRPRRQRPERLPFGTTCTMTDEPEELEDMHLPDRGFGKYGAGRLPYKDGRLDSDFFHRNEPEDHRALRRYAEKLSQQKFPRR